MKNKIKKVTSLCPDLYKIKDKFTYKEMAKLVKIARQALFDMNDRKFFQSVELNVMLEGHFIGTYNSVRSGIQQNLYRELLVTYIQKCNDILTDGCIYKNYMFDITGDWDAGGIIIMEKK